jgi:ubiquinone/menaquinone biosynthesis C-methylase UbiE
MNNQAQIKQWQLDGHAPEAYERYLVPAFFARWAERLVDSASIQPGERILDVACGTGIVARTAAPRAGSTGSVVAIDINGEMLATARKASTDGDLTIAWQTGDAADIPFGDGSFDIVFCQQALQFFPSPSDALSEMNRVLAPNGRVALNVLRPLERNPVYRVLADALERHAGAAAGTMMRSPFPSWDIEQLRDLVSDAKFQDIHIRHIIEQVRFPSPEEFLRREASSSPLAASLESLHTEVLDDLLDTLEESLAGFTDDDGITFPIATSIVSARK